VKLSDGKGIGGPGRLTDSVINKLQVCFGNAIRANKNCFDDMRKAVWAIWFHECSTDLHPQHAFGPKGPQLWCGC
jgi:hypothetical protein